MKISWSINIIFITGFFFVLLLIPVAVFALTEPPVDLPTVISPGTDICGKISYNPATGTKLATCQNNLCNEYLLDRIACECQANHCCVEYKNGKPVAGSLVCIRNNDTVQEPVVAASKAVTFEPQIPLPGFLGGPVSGSQFGEYLKAFYKYFSGVVGILAAAMIVFGGFQWITAAGNASRIENAKTTISGALIGLVLTLTAYIFLNTINPELVQFKSINPIIVQPKELAAVVTECPTDANLVDLKTYYPNNAVLTVDSSVRDPRVNQAMIPKLDKAAKALKDKEYQLIITSAHRSLQYQGELYQCYLKCNPTTCPDGCNEAAAPSCSAPHTMGMAVDVCVKKGVDDQLCHMIDKNFNGATGIYGQYQLDLQQAMLAAGFSRFCGEWWHFESQQLSKSLCLPGFYK